MDKNLVSLLAFYRSPQIEIICVDDVLTLSNDPATDDGYGEGGGFEWGEK